MSKLYETYLFLKKSEDNNTLLLFKSGIFFIFLENDARIASNILNLKITHLNENIIKCGFPKNSLDKYLNLINQTSYKVKIIDSSNNTYYKTNEYVINEEIMQLLYKISKIDTYNLSIKEAYEFIDVIKSKAINLLGGNLNVK